MHTYLILPIGGLSTRFSATRPKWMLTHPSGCMMITEAIRGIDLSKFHKIVLITIAEHEEKYEFKKQLVNELENEYSLDSNKIEIVFLKKQTKSQPETIYEGLKLLKITEGSILIKDSDNYFKFEHNDDEPGGYVATSCLHEHDKICAGNKSYIKVGERGLISNIIEKQIISNDFCVGAYFFKDVNSFYGSYDEIKDMSGEIHVSHIIYDDILKGGSYFSKKVSGYVDWGTKDEWVNFNSQYKTIFCDIDGVLVKNSAHHFKPFWGTTEPIVENIKAMQDLYESGKVHIILTTSRTEEYRHITEEQLKKANFSYHRLIMGLPHGHRLLINDFASTNSYPSASAINLPRNSNELGNYL